MPEQDIDWKTVFEIASSQRDDATRSLQNTQLELMLERKTTNELKARIAELEAPKKKNSHATHELQETAFANDQVEAR